MEIKEKMLEHRFGIEIEMTGITREKAATGTVDPEEDNTNQDVVVTPEEETEQITPPNTGAESNLFISLGLLALLAGVVSLKKMCK